MMPDDPVPRAKPVPHDPSPTGTDHVELHAAEVAQRAGHAAVTDEDRRVALEEMQKTAPPAPPDEEASH